MLALNYVSGVHWPYIFGQMHDHPSCLLSQHRLDKAWGPIENLTDIQATLGTARVKQGQWHTCGREKSGTSWLYNLQQSRMDTEKSSWRIGIHKSVVCRLFLKKAREPEATQRPWSADLWWLMKKMTESCPRGMYGRKICHYSHVERVAFN